MPPKRDAEELKASDARKLLGTIEFPQFLVSAMGSFARFFILLFAIYNAFRIRTYALTEYGRVIHEFDPWFNFRATQYLSKNGWHAFFHWFDHMSWYPLGRPVGTTIYPGLQLTAVAIHRVLRWIGKPWRMSLNDVCCFIPCWGGATATFFLYMLTYECSGSSNAAVVAALIMSVIPSHLMRSIGGGFDNESIAMTAIIMTFYFWVRSIRTRSSWPIGIVAGLSYGYMVAAWGGFVFVLNMVALHAAFLTATDALRGVYSTRVYKAYSLFYIVGTSIAVHVPPVGWMPFKSLEQLLAFVVFVGLQALHFSEILRKRADVEIHSRDGWKIRVRVFSFLLAGIVAVCFILAPTGFFGPLSSRVRGLFVRHTRTGNPLVDSVAEHQPSSPDAYWHYGHYACYGWGFGTVLLPLISKVSFRTYSFLLLNSLVAYFFSLKMARLILLSAPVASALSGICIGRAIDWAMDQFYWNNEEKEKKPEGMLGKLAESYGGARSMRLIVAVAIIAVLLSGKHYRDFNEHGEQMAHSFSNPQLMFKTRLHSGKTVIIDDYREAYLWVKKNTPEDARVMAWWDYGYQIAGIANRTSIADGNTWNHEHIATLGKCLTSPVKEAHSLIRHLADYVLVWAGGGSDDLAKSPHMARIGNSVYRNICPKDPLCSKFGFRGQNHQDPTPMMRKSLLYNLHAHKLRQGVEVDSKLFQEAFSSKYGLVRVFKVMNVSEESKQWLADPANYKCDAPGSWYCEGQYPPAEEIQALLKVRRDFSQLENFNSKTQDDEYYNEYMRRMGNM